MALVPWGGRDACCEQPQRTANPTARMVNLSGVLIKVSSSVGPFLFLPAAAFPDAPTMLTHPPLERGATLIERRPTDDLAQVERTAHRVLVLIL